MYCMFTDYTGVFHCGGVQNKPMLVCLCVYATYSVSVCEIEPGSTSVC